VISIKLDTMDTPALASSQGVFIRFSNGHSVFITYTGQQGLHEDMYMDVHICSDYPDCLGRQISLNIFSEFAGVNKPFTEPVNITSIELSRDSGDESCYF
jgi:hypothetical protein